MNDKETKGEMLVRQGAERRARAKNEPPKKPVSLLISKDRGIRVEPISARKDPELRAKQIQEKKEEETRRLAKVEKDKKMNRDVAARKAQAQANREAAAQDKIAADRKAEEEREFDEEIARKAQEEIDASTFPVVNTATVAAQKLADEHGIIIAELDGGIDNRINLGEVKAAISAISGEE